MGEFRFGPAEEETLLALGLNQVEWLQRAEEGGRSAEEVLMDFCSRNGWWMTVYYEPRGYSPYDKLHNWTRQTEVDADFTAKVEGLSAELLAQWDGQPGFGGYLVGHEDYRESTYEALGRTIEILQRRDPGRPALTVGHIDSYQAVGRFLDTFFTEGGAANVFQHEHYVFREGVPSEGRGLQRALDRLVESYDRVAQRLRGRHGRWHAVLQVQSEWRQGAGENGMYYRKPDAVEVRLQAGLALSRGAAGIIYFLYSSGDEEALNGEGELVQRRRYEGLVHADGRPTELYDGVRRLNADLARLGAALQGLRFYGAFAGGDLRDNPLVRRAEPELEFGLFGGGDGDRYLLAVNRRARQARKARLSVVAEAATDALSGVSLPLESGQVVFDLEPGGMRLLKFTGAGP